MELTNDAASWWLAAFIDGEGCVYYRNCTRGRRNVQARVVTMSNTEKSIVDFAVRCLAQLGIRHTVLFRTRASVKHRDYWTIEVRRGFDMARLRAMVPIQSEKKRAKLDLALSSYRGLHCVCGCLRDEYTEGCVNCRKRHYFRARSNSKQADKPVSKWITKDRVCKGCGCSYDARTPGCENCRSRHSVRANTAQI